MGSGLAICGKRQDLSLPHTRARGMGTGGAFAGPLGRPPLPILVAVLAPLALFLTASRLSPGFHDLVMAADLCVLVSCRRGAPVAWDFWRCMRTAYCRAFSRFRRGWAMVAFAACAALGLWALLRRDNK